MYAYMYIYIYASLYASIYIYIVYIYMYSTLFKCSCTWDLRHVHDTCPGTLLGTLTLIRRTQPAHYARIPRSLSSFDEKARSRR